MEFKKKSKLNKILAVGKFLGFIPWSCKVAGKFAIPYDVVYFPIHIVLLVVLIMGGDKRIFNDKLIDNVLFVLLWLPTYLFTPICYLSSTTHRVSFKNLITTIEDIVNTHDTKIKTNRVKMIMCWLLFVVELNIIIFHGGSYIYRFCSINSVILGFILIYVFVTAFWYMYMINHITNIIISKYECIEQTLKKVACQQNSQEEYKVIRKMVHQLFKTVNLINDIFGIPLITIVVHTFLGVMWAADLLIFLPTLYCPEILQHFIFLIYLTLFFALVVSNCDEIEKRYSKIIITCNMLQIKANGFAERDEIIAFLQYLKNMPPKIAPFGIIGFNMNLLTKMFTSLVSCVIIMVQLHIIDLY